MKSHIDLNNLAAERFERWFENVAKPAVAMEAVFEELMAVVGSNAGRQCVLLYELRPHHTLSHRSEFFRIDPGDLIIPEAGIQEPPILPH